MTYRILFLLCFCFLGYTQNVIAQETTPKEKRQKSYSKSDSIQLKNGPIFIGKIIQETADSITIRLAYDKLTFHQNDIEKITPRQSNRYAHTIQIAYLFGKSYLNPYDDPFSDIYFSNISKSGLNISYIVERKIAPYFNPGICIGLNTYERGNFATLNLDMRGEVFPQKSKTPYYYGGIGYGFLIEPKNPDRSLNVQYTISPHSIGGLLYNYGIGIKVKTNKNNLLLAFGQQSQFMQWIYQDLNTGYQLQKTWHNRFAFTFGIEF